MHNSILITIFIASFTTLLSIYLLRPFAVSTNLVDSPNNRKLHKGSVPLIGGISMYIAIVVSVMLSSYDLYYFLLASSVIVIMGVLDDYQNISFKLRLLIQVLTAFMLVIVANITLESVGNLFGFGDIFLYEWAYFVSVLAIVVGMNAVNMSDGIHGLAGGNSLITFLAIIYLSIENASHEDLFIIIIFCSILPIFLIYNLCLGLPKTKRIFMGDAGSMLIGLTIVWFLITLSQGDNQIFSPVVALWLFAVPLIEMLTVTIRRVALGRSPFVADLSHFHHLLPVFGIRKETTLLLMLLISSITALIGVLGEIYDVADWFMFLSFLGVFTVYFFYHGLALKKAQNII